MTKETTDDMMSDIKTDGNGMTIGVAMFIDGVKLGVGLYKVKRFPLTHFGEVIGKAVDISIKSKDMVSVLQDMGYEVKKYEVKKTEGDRR